MYKLLNPIASEKFLNEIYIKIQNLSDFLYIGTVYKNKQDRFIIYKKFLIFYEIQEKEKIVLIKTIIHKNENIYT